MKQLLRSFLPCGRGNASVIFALGALPVLLCAGMAIDKIRADNARTELQAAVDGAALAAAMAESKTSKERETIARAFFKKTTPLAQSAAFTVKVNGKSVSAVADTKIPNSIMSLAGLPTSEIKVVSEAMRPRETYAEVVMVLDYSHSMVTNDKYIRMAAAANELVTSLSGAIPAGKLKIGLVPFSAMVQASMPSGYVSQFTWSSTWTGCTQDRNYPYNQGLDPPNIFVASSKWGYIDGSGENASPYDCSAYQANNLQIQPLTTDLAGIKAKLSSMTPVGNTNIPLGAEFGWNLLDPQPPYTEAAPYTDPNTKKYLILLTDGVQTSSASGSDGTRSVANGNDNLVSLCKEIDKKKITIFTIAYDITDSKVTDLLKQCAGDNYYEPGVSKADISAVFESISKEIKNNIVRLAR